MKLITDIRLLFWRKMKETLRNPIYMLNSLLNPKALLFYGAFLPQFIDPGRDLLTQFVVMATVFVVIEIGVAYQGGIEVYSTPAALRVLATAEADPRQQANLLAMHAEKAGRGDDFFQLGMLMCRDALERRESCGGHFRAEYQDAEGEAQRDDEHFAHVAAWEWTGDPMKAIRNVEELEFEAVHLATRSYK